MADKAYLWLSVANDRDKFLKAVTVIIKRDGFDAKNNDWFWVKYKPNGKLFVTPTNIKVVGKVPGCISCHASASGTDMVFAHNKDANQPITVVK